MTDKLYTTKAKCLGLSIYQKSRPTQNSSCADATKSPVQGAFPLILSVVTFSILYFVANCDLFHLFCCLLPTEKKDKPSSLSFCTFKPNYLPSLDSTTYEKHVELLQQHGHFRALCHVF